MDNSIPPEVLKEIRETSRRSKRHGAGKPRVKKGKVAPRRSSSGNWTTFAERSLPNGDRD